MMSIDNNLSLVLVDPRSSLNVMPRSTLVKLATEWVLMRPSVVVVRDFYGARRYVMGEINLPMKIGPYVFQITFQVMDINQAYNCSLERPRIHVVSAITSIMQ